MGLSLRYCGKERGYCLKVKEALQIFQKLEMEIREGRDTLAIFKWEGKIRLIYCRRCRKANRTSWT